MKIQLLIILLFIVNHSLAQNSAQLIDKSIGLIANDAYANFERSYPEIWNAYLKENVPFYTAATSEIQKKHFEKAIENINSLITEGYFLDEILLEKDFLPLHGLVGWKKVEEQIERVKSHYNNPVREELVSLKKRDQSIRLILLTAQKTHSNDIVLIRKIQTQMNKIDVESASVVAKIVDQNGWLGKDKIGSEGNETLFLGIQHIDDLLVQNKYLPILEAAVKNGNAEPWHFAFLTDRILMNQGKKQIYGTQTITSIGPKDAYIVPLQDPDKVDVLRKEIGLEPLNEYLEEFGMTWNLEAYKKDLGRIEKLYTERSVKSRK